VSSRADRPAVVFDVIGTLFDFAPARQALVELGAPAAALEAWFQRVVHEAATLTILGDYRPFKELAAAALQTTLAQLGLDPDATRPLDALAELAPYPDAPDALERLRDAGLTLAALTNGSQESTEELLDRGGLRRYLRDVLSCDEVRRFKPHRAPYELALQRVGGSATMVAAHGWDIVGARSAGLETIWVAREEKSWPFPLDPPASAPHLAGAADAILTPSDA
jgi:2-haloacid dehalogenase